MLISDEEVSKRLNSSSNLMNRLRSESSPRTKAMQLFGMGIVKDDVKNNIPSPQKFVSPFLKPEIPVSEKKEELPKTDSKEAKSEGLDTGEKLGLIADAALETMMTAIKNVKENLGDLSNPQKLADVAAKMGKIVTDIKNSKKEDEDKSKHVHIHFYTPEQKKMEEFNAIDV